MQSNEYSIAEYVKDIREIVKNKKNDSAITEAIKPFSQKLAASSALQKDEYRVCNEEQGFGVHLLHEEDNHDLGVFVLSWLPDRGTLPHNHITWAVVTTMEGQEHEVLWERKDDGAETGYAKIEKVQEATMRRGDVSICMPQDIHSVWNTGEELSISLHTYGRHINFTGRSQFDPENDREIPFVVSVED